MDFNEAFLEFAVLFHYTFGVSGSDEVLVQLAEKGVVLERYVLLQRQIRADEGVWLR